MFFAEVPDGNETLSTRAALVSLGILLVGYFIPWFTLPRSKSEDKFARWLMLICVFPIAALIAFFVSNAYMPSKYNIRVDIGIFGILWLYSIGNIALSLYRYRHPVPPLECSESYQLRASILIILALLVLVMSPYFWPVTLILSPLLILVSIVSLLKLWNNKEDAGTVRRLKVVIVLAFVAISSAFYWM